MAAPLKARVLGWAGGLAVLAACASPGLSPHRSPATRPVPRVPAVPTPVPTPLASYPQERPLNQGRPVTVRSRSLRYDHATQETVFYGGVTATQDTTRLLSRELRDRASGQSAEASGGVLVTDAARRLRIRSGKADYTDSLREATMSEGVHLVSVDPYGASITVTGRSGSYSDLSRSARVTGGVRVTHGILGATAWTATVLDGGSLLVLQKDVRAAMGFNRLQAERAEFDQKRHSVDLRGDVRVRLIPSEVRAAAAAPWAISASAQEGP